MVKVKVKSYTRKDGTKVKASTRRQNTLKGHLKKGAKWGAVIDSTTTGLVSGLVGGAVGGPGLAIGSGLIGAGTGALRGATIGTASGAGTYALKKKFAKNRSKKNFDYSIGNLNSMYEFRRPRRDKGRKRGKRSQQNKIGAHIRGGAKIGAAFRGIQGGLGGYAVGRMTGMSKRAALATGAVSSIAGAGRGAVEGGIAGAGVYGAKKAFAKNKSKRRFDY